MKRVGLRNKIIAHYWRGVPRDDIRHKVKCTQQTVNKWLNPLQDVPLCKVPRTLLSLGWTPGEIIRVLKIDEDELKNEYGVVFKARGLKVISDERLIELIDSEHSPQEIADITEQDIRYVRSRLRDLGWVKSREW